MSSMGTPFLFHFWGLHIVNCKWANFYQNLSAGSINNFGWNDLKKEKKLLKISQSGKALNHT